MHSLDGALSESLLIYQNCIKQAIDHSSVHILSMGLGLGYNEIIAATLLLKNKVSDYRLCSFESLPELRIFFMAWLKGQHCELEDVYDQIVTSIARLENLESTQIKKFLLNGFENQAFQIESALPTQNPWPWKFQSILYDAFSAKTDPSLWTEPHLIQFLNEFSDPNFCFFSTYAATGNLKRSLSQQGFTVQKQAGFGKKRESTFAYRP